MEEKDNLENLKTKWCLFSEELTSKGVIKEQNVSQYISTLLEKAAASKKKLIVSSKWSLRLVAVLTVLFGITTILTFFLKLEWKSVSSLIDFLQLFYISIILIIGYALERQSLLSLKSLKISHLSVEETLQAIQRKLLYERKMYLLGVTLLLPLLCFQFQQNLERGYSLSRCLLEALAIFVIASSLSYACCHYYVFQPMKEIQKALKGIQKTEKENA